MEKRGVVDENTPDSPVEKQAAEKPCCGGRCKNAGARRDEHLTTKLGDAAADAIRGKS